jgi:hypothetical protein
VLLQTASNTPPTVPLAFEVVQQRSRTSPTMRIEWQGPYPCTEEELLRTGGSNMTTGGFPP